MTTKDKVATDAIIWKEEKHTRDATGKFAKVEGGEAPEHVKNLHNSIAEKNGELSDFHKDFLDEALEDIQQEAKNLEYTSTPPIKKKFKNKIIAINHALSNMFGVDISHNTLFIDPDADLLEIKKQAFAIENAIDASKQKKKAAQQQEQEAELPDLFGEQSVAPSSTASAVEDPNKSVTFKTIDDLPSELNGIPFEPWLDAPKTNDGWEKIADNQSIIDTPFFESVPGKKSAAGVIIQEPDGRVWLMHPKGEYGGVKATFPKGTLEIGMTLEGTAIKEAFEESGLQVELTGFAGDVERSTSKARYYYAKRIGGTPLDAGEEADGVSLVTPEELDNFLNMKVDKEGSLSEEI
jgi:ADP-ribose pyrophosphatase YjhB (NUDIX family)